MSDEETQCLSSIGTPFVSKALQTSCSMSNKTERVIHSIRSETSFEASSIEMLHFYDLAVTNNRPCKNRVNGDARVKLKSQSIPVRPQTARSIVEKFRNTQNIEVQVNTRI